MSATDREKKLSAELAALRLSLTKTLETVSTVETNVQRTFLITNHVRQALDNKLKCAADAVDCMFVCEEDEEDEDQEGGGGGGEEGGGGGEEEGGRDVPPPPTSTITTKQPPVPPPSLPLPLPLPQPLPSSENFKQDDSVPLAPPARVAIAMLIRDPPLVSMATFIRYHLAIGIQHIYLYFDDILNENVDIKAMEIANSFNNVSVFHCNETWFQQTKQEAGGSGTMWSEYGEYLHTDLIARQVIAVEQALHQAQLNSIDWLLHIDIDELLYWTDEKYILGGMDTEKAEMTNTTGLVGGAAATCHDAGLWFANEIPLHIDCVRFLNEEAAPESIEMININHQKQNVSSSSSSTSSTDYFQELTLFKRNPTKNMSKPTLYLSHWPKGKAVFTAYSNGKSAVRVESGVIPLGSHKFRSNEKILLSMDAVGAEILHYPNASFSLWFRKYALLGTFPDYWCGGHKIPDGCFHLQSRNVVVRSSSEKELTDEDDEAQANATTMVAARALYSEQVVFDKQEEKEALLHAGLLVRREDIAAFIKKLWDDAVN